MNDETNPHQPVPEPEDEQETQPKPPSRLDRLMSAKDKSEKEAAQWGEIEKIGKPLPSHDQSGQEVTQSFAVEPPRKEGDTPSGYDTPAQPMPPVSAVPARPQAPPPFPHPTDRPAAPPAASQPPRMPHPTDPSPRTQPMSPEPPMPSRTDQADIQKGVKPLGGQPHQRYQPPGSLDEVRVDSNGMPLPRRIPREDADATLVGESAYLDEIEGSYADKTQPHGYPHPDFQTTQPAAPAQAEAYTRPRRAAAPRRAARPLGRRLQFSWGCVARVVGLGFIGALVTVMLGGTAAAAYYAQVTGPSFEGISRIDDLQKKALQFETTRIRAGDEQGTILYELNDPNGGFRDYVKLEEISPWVIVGTVATEERQYFTNPGFSIPAMARAVYQAYREGRAIMGTSTITQQLTRALLLPEDERTQRSYQRKIKEIFLAGELGRRFSKKEILELYLNQIYYGNLAYGIEAAAQTYFQKSAKDLTMAEASFLVGLPQAPAVWDPVTDKEAALVRQTQQVLPLMLKAGCIDTGDTDLDLSQFCVTDALLVEKQPELQMVAAREYHAPAFQARYPHWVVYIQQLLENDPAIGRSIYTSGYDVYTTIDPRLQDLAQEQVNLVLSGLTDRNVNNASVVAIDPHTGAILAMVGSKDFNDESIDGQVNIPLTPQQPGSSIKPFTYLTAFRKGWTPSTVIWDVPISYDIPGFGVYAPENYDGRAHGPIPVRAALANSYNVPAVQTLDFVGVPALLQTLNDVGITSLGDPSNPNNYGLSLTLGAGEVYLLEWANAFATLANRGQYHPPYAIKRIEKDGQVVQEYQVPEGKQAMEPDLVYLLTSILSDKEARVPAFGQQSPLSPPYPAAAKTGTTNDFRDNWTMGYTTNLAIGVWVGNTDNSPMVEVSGVTGAGPIWRGIMDGSQQWYPAQAFARPASIIEQTVCSDDGALPSPYCTEHSTVRTDVFVASNPPPPADKGLYRQLRVDQFTGLIANENCPDYAEDKFFVMLPNPSQTMGIDVPAFERDWLLNTDAGRDWATRRALPLDRFEAAPTEACKPDTPKPTIVIDSPQPGSEQSGVVTVIGTVDAPNFSHYTVDFGVSDSPIGWGVMQGDTAQAVHGGPLAQADLSAYGSGIMTIRVTVYDTEGHHAERRTVFNFIAPTPTPAPTDMPTPTSTPTLTPPPVTPTVTPTETPTTEATPE